MKLIVFVGPSLSGASTRQVVSVELLPPAKMGDITKAVEAGARYIGLIDGIFESERSVWHKEILYALGSGAKVFGAGSLGALRAVECESFGMRGYGKIFHDYQSGTRTQDADVALLFAPAELDYAPLTVTQADFEHTLQGLAIRSLLSQQEADLLARLSRTIFYKERTIEAIFQLARSAVSENLENLVRHNWVNQKSEDAQALIHGFFLH